MDWDRESSILREAAFRGLIRGGDEQELERLLLEPPPAVPSGGGGLWGPRIERLIRAGRIGERTVEALAAEFDRQPTRRVVSTPARGRAGQGDEPGRGRFDRFAEARGGAGGAEAGPLPGDRSDRAGSQPVAWDDWRGGEERKAWPVEDWDHFELVAFLGEGGMGRVYKAYDRRLGRLVAIKFLRGDDATASARFLQEAQSQARVEHEYVCKIFEVGEVQGKLYIAMQYLAGETLLDAGPKMTLRERVKVMQQVAEGIHAAHRLGLIHRDIKPVNVLVERGEDGRWRPHVLDFGLAREVEAPGLTQTGLIIGTPAYLAPEQARGESSRLDARTDVHALGATLYSLLVGRSPYDGGTPLEILHKVIAGDPLPLRKIDSTLPPDLETIVSKCLEKDPARRYESARAFADDLGRFLDGEPIAARPPSVTYRLAKKARKHRTAMAAAAAAALGVLVFGGIALRTELQTREQTRLASVFGQEVQYIDEILRRAYTAPLHAIVAEKRGVRERLQALERQVAQAGGAGAGPGHYAIGRALLVLGETESAQRHLKRAWDGGYRVPEVAYTLGRAYGDLYRRELEQAERLESGQALAEWKRDLGLAYREPALGYLKASQGVRVDAPEYVRALMAFYDNRPAEAQSEAEAALRKVPWLYEAPLLVGDIAVARAEDRRDHGDGAGSDAAYRQAESAYRQAAAIGQSDPRAYEGLSGFWQSRMETLSQRWQDLRPCFAGLTGSAFQALTADPAYVPAYSRLAHAYKMWAQELMRRNQVEGVEEALQRSFRAATKVIDLKRDAVDGYFDRGLACLQQARFWARHAIDPRRPFECAIRSFEEALPIYPKLPKLREDLGNAYLERAEADVNFGRDPRPSFDQAALHYGKALELQPRNAVYLFLQGNLDLSRGRLEQGVGDPTPHLEQAIAAYQRSREINAHDDRIDQNLGNAYLALARYRIDHGQDPGEALPSAVASYRRAVAARPQNPGAYTSLGNAAAELARFRAARGEDPRGAAAEAEAFLRQAIAADPGGVGLEARPAPPAASAPVDDAGAEASAVNADHAFAYGRLARLQAFLAVYEAEHGRSPRAALDAAAAAAESARDYSPNYPVVWADAGEVEIVRARCAIVQGRSPARSFKDAAADLQHALELNATYLPAFLPLADLHRRQAEWRAAHGRSARDEIAKGLEAVGKSLAFQPQNAQALADQGVLELLAARSEAQAARRSEAVRRARAALARALAINRNLESELRPYLDRADALLRSSAG